MNEYNIPHLPLSYDLETKAVLKQLNQANRRLAELKGVALTIPNENILVALSPYKRQRIVLRLRILLLLKMTYIREQRNRFQTLLLMPQQKRFSTIEKLYSMVSTLSRRKEC